MLIMMTRKVAVIIHAVSPLFAAGAGAAAAAGAAVAGADAAGAEAAGAEAAGAAGAAGEFRISATCTFSEAEAAGASAAAANCEKPVASISMPAASRLTNCFFMEFSLECFIAGFAGADAHDLLKVADENFSVADFSGAGRSLDRLDRAIDDGVIGRCLDFGLRQEIDDIFRAAIQFGMPFLPAAALALGDRDALDADRGQGFAHFVQFERLVFGCFLFLGCFVCVFWFSFWFSLLLL